MIGVRQRSKGTWYFIIKNKNGEIMCSSEDYASKSGCEQGIVRLKRISQEWSI